jgi:protein-tyrosine phosphatase
MDTPIPDSYWVLPGRLLAGEYPATRDEAGSRLKLGTILSAGVTAFIDLTEIDELVPYSDLLPPTVATSNIQVTHTRMPIRDLGVPTAPGMSAILERVNTLLDNEEVVYVHCWGGIGRTGTVVGCYMVKRWG